MGRILNKMIYSAIRFLDYIWPKDSTIMLFGSRGGHYPAGNAKAVFNHILALTDTPFKVYFALAEESNDPNHVRIRKPSLRTILLFLRAKTLLMNNSLGDFGNFRPSRRKNVIHLWHGQGPKSDGYASRKFNEEMLQDSEHWHRYTTAFLTCSRLDSYMRSYAHVLHPRQILPLGYPRCDFLFNEESGKSKLGEVFNDLPEYDKVILYAPTWRTYGPIRFFPFDDYSYEELKSWSKRKRILVLIRSHEADSTKIEESDYIRNLHFEIQPDVSEILPEVDVLVNDYSSIQSDFLLLNRPIVYVPYDLDIFLKNQNFCYPNYDFWCPGEKVSTFEGFKKAIEDALWGEDQYSEQRVLVNGLINEFQKPNATQRVYRYLLGLLGFEEPMDSWFEWMEVK